MQLTQSGQAWVMVIMHYFRNAGSRRPSDITARVIMEAFAADILSPPSSTPTHSYRKAFQEAVDRRSSNHSPGNVGLCWLLHAGLPQIYDMSTAIPEELAQVWEYLRRRSSYFRQLLAVEQQQLSSAGLGMYYAGGSPEPVPTLRGEPDTSVRIDTWANSGREPYFRPQRGMSFWEEATLRQYAARSTITDDSWQPSVVFRPGDTEADTTVDTSV